MSRAIIISWPRTPVPVIQNLAQLAATVQFSDPDVAEHTLIEATIPAGTFTTSGRGRVSTKLSGRFTTNNVIAGTCTLRVRLGASVLATEVIDVTVLPNNGIYSYVLTLDISAREGVRDPLVVGELLGQFQEPQGFQPTPGLWGVRQAFAFPFDISGALLFSVTAQFDAVIDGTWVTEYAHIDRVVGS